MNTHTHTNLHNYVILQIYKKLKITTIIFDNYLFVIKLI